MKNSITVLFQKMHTCVKGSLLLLTRETHTFRKFTDSGRSCKVWRLLHTSNWSSQKTNFISILWLLGCWNGLKQGAESGARSLEECCVSRALCWGLCQVQWVVCRAPCALSVYSFNVLSSDVFLFFFLFCCSLLAGDSVFLFFVWAFKLQQSVAKRSVFWTVIVT